MKIRIGIYGLGGFGSFLLDTFRQAGTSHQYELFDENPRKEQILKENLKKEELKNIEFDSNPKQLGKYPDPCEIVFECVPDMDKIKQKTVRLLDFTTPSKTTIVTTAVTVNFEELAGHLGRPDRLLKMNYDESDERFSIQELSVTDDRHYSKLEGLISSV